MQEFCVATNDPENLLEMFEGIDEIKIESADRKVTFYADTDVQMQGLKTNMPHRLTKYILGTYESQQLYRLIHKICPNMPVKDRQKIHQIALKNAQDTSRKLHFDGIENKLFEYLRREERISIEGFVNFRLPEYREELREIAQTSVDMFFGDREYDEFIELLKCFVNLQEPKVTTIHIVSEDDGRYSIYNQHKHEITHQCADDFMSEYTIAPVNYDDILISSLITLSPKRIVFHKTENITKKEVFETISRVFGNKVRICNTCEWCAVRG